MIARTVVAMRRAVERCWYSSPGGAECVLLEWAARRATRRTLTLAARRTVAAHWPSAEGGCPVCVLPDCQAFRTAVAYLDLIGDDYLPVHQGGSAARYGSAGSGLSSRNARIASR
ncbi:hypothetical protein [Plantactinospora sp. B6F1]|uniref:hypothetical protein n=1 Tax=Plantactinospora sp. B6F1 TaxID=3158971 RepID=UPI0032D901A4